MTGASRWSADQFVGARSAWRGSPPAHTRGRREGTLVFRPHHYARRAHMHEVAPGFAAEGGVVVRDRNHFSSGSRYGGRSPNRAPGR